MTPTGLEKPEARVEGVAVLLSSGVAGAGVLQRRVGQGGALPGADGLAAALLGKRHDAGAEGVGCTRRGGPAMVVAVPDGGTRSGGGGLLSVRRVHLCCAQKQGGGQGPRGVVTTGGAAETSSSRQVLYAMFHRCSPAPV